MADPRHNHTYEFIQVNVEGVGINNRAVLYSEVLVGGIPKTSNLVSSDPVNNNQPAQHGIDNGKSHRGDIGPNLGVLQPEPDEPSQERLAFFCRQEEPQQIHVIEKDHLENELLPLWPSNTLHDAYPKIFYGNRPWQVNKAICDHYQTRYEMPVFADNTQFDWEDYRNSLHEPNSSGRSRPNPGPMRAVFIHRGGRGNILCDVLIHPFGGDDYSFRQCELRVRR
ncbi:hypothetical protein F5B20DRAFT_591419 [Whalleya microplaca]|nr:hypothetical protein F5B20DRAFT_591419 [Whalleya microplaca]